MNIENIFTPYTSIPEVLISNAQVTFSNDAYSFTVALDAKLSEELNFGKEECTLTFNFDKDKSILGFNYTVGKSVNTVKFISIDKAITVAVPADALDYKAPAPDFVALFNTAYNMVERASYFKMDISVVNIDGTNASTVGTYHYERDCHGNDYILESSSSGSVSELWTYNSEYYSAASMGNAYVVGRQTWVIDKQHQLDGFRTLALKEAASDLECDFDASTNIYTISYTSVNGDVYAYAFTADFSSIAVSVAQPAIGHDAQLTTIAFSEINSRAFAVATPRGIQ